MYWGKMNAHKVLVVYLKKLDASSNAERKARVTASMTKLPLSKCLIKQRDQVLGNGHYYEKWKE